MKRTIALLLGSLALAGSALAQAPASADLCGKTFQDPQAKSPAIEITTSALPSSR